MSNCNIDWNEKSLNNLSYFIVVWTLDFIVPLICIFKCLYASLKLVKKLFIFTHLNLEFRFFYDLIFGSKDKIVKFECSIIIKSPRFTK